MNRLKLTPIIRGAYLNTGCLPFVVSGDEQTTLPELKLPSLKTDDIAILGNEAGTGLAAMSHNDGSLPTAIRVAGIGSFFAGKSLADAEQLRRQTEAGTDGVLTAAGVQAPTSIVPKADVPRNDVVRGRISLVTGGAQGFGAEIVRGLIDSGSFVFIADINKEGADAFAAQFNQDGQKRAVAIAVDVSNEDSVKAMADEIVGVAGGLDLLVSNAGVLRAGSVLELSAADFDFVTKINYNAFFLVVKHLAPIMVCQQAAAPNWTADIIQINSKSGLVGSNKNGAYAGGKFGGIGLVQSFAMELVEYRIKVNAICPGNFFDGPLWSDPDRGLFVQYLNAGKVPGANSIADVKKFYEDKVPMGRGCEGEDVMRAIFYCVDQQYETGQAVPVTGGQVMLK